MEKHLTVHILNTLAQGIDPHTGESFPPASPYQHADTVRALFQAVQSLSATTDAPAERARSARQGSAGNAGKPWSDEEDNALAEGFDAGHSVRTLAEQHRRTRAAIQARLVRLGKIEPTADMPRYRIALPEAQAA